MHQRLFVTFAAEQAGSSSIARRYVDDTLAEEGFVISGRFSGGWADAYAIGGRWTGELSNIAMSDRVKRDPYRALGYPDDAKLVTKEIYDRLLKPYEGIHGTDEAEILDFEDDTVSPDFVGKKWVVVVDYHN